MGRTVADMDVLSRREITQVIRSEKVPRNRALMSLLYLTGARISEALLAKRKDMWKEVIGEEGFIVIRMRTLKKYDIIDKHLNADGTKTFTTRLRTEHRNIPIRISRDRDILNHLIGWANSKRSGELLFPISRQWAWKIMNKHGFFNHYWRHCRNTHLVTQRNFTDQDLVKFHGWADSKPATIYTHLRWKDLAKKM